MTGVQIRCHQCALISQPDDETGSFIVHAPLDLPGEERRLYLNLRCNISGSRHQIAIDSIVDEAGSEVRTSDTAYREIQALLDRIAAAKVCGSQKICPKEVLRLVDAPSV